MMSLERRPLAREAGPPAGNFKTGPPTQAAHKIAPPSRPTWTGREAINYATRAAPRAWRREAHHLNSLAFEGAPLRASGRVKLINFITLIILEERTLSPARPIVPARSCS